MCCLQLRVSPVFGGAEAGKLEPDYRNSGFGGLGFRVLGLGFVRLLNFRKSGHYPPHPMFQLSGAGRLHPKPYAVKRGLGDSEKNPGTMDFELAIVASRPKTKSMMTTGTSNIHQPTQSPKTKSKHVLSDRTDRPRSPPLTAS